MKVFLNGIIQTEEEAVISVFDHGFLYGFGMFETLRAYQGKLFLYEQHYERLWRSAEKYQITMNKSQSELQNDIYHTMEANGLQDAYIRVTLSGGAEGLGLYGETHAKPTWLIMAKPLGPMSSVKSMVTLQLPRSTPEGLTRAKSLSYANGILAKKELVQRNLPTAEGLFLNTEGYMVEGTVSNLFFVKKGQLYTPHKDTGLLSGVTRDWIIQLCKYKGIPIHEGFYTLDDLMEAKEVFITNSIQEIVAIDQVDGREVPSVKGPLTSYFIEQYQLTVQRLGGDSIGN
ncbi:aminotransferase class IV [Ammoniphilus sp. YIM 78166]|uniref:aminotransferase class IV n=1 Tax=Ammoniphilus sp. YIM 78166 TaxID=1644106 RepID=UPI00106F427E|nr:aminotransferase class IV [Ammoniphilus sp. YIM 78166]